MGKITYVTSESVTEGHPDKVADAVSDSILDALFKEDPMSRVAVETLTTTGTVHVAGEVTTKAFADIPSIVRQTLKDIGYTDSAYGLDCDTCGVWIAIDEQSPDIAQGVDEGKGEHTEQGAGDQGMMYGFACDETKELMPLPISLAHKLTRRLAYVRKEGIIAHLGPDGKSQVSIQYDDAKPVKATAIVIAQQHTAKIEEQALKEQIMEHVIKPIVGDWLTEETEIHINATGQFIIGGPHGDCGLTGRKIIVDTYGGVGRHGGGAFSGKDPSKVDRSAAYAARYVAKNIVAAGLATKCEVQLSYAIGVPKPTSVNVDCFGTNKIDEDKISELVNKHFDLSPKGIIDGLKLRRPIFKKTSAYGHFGREDPDFTWEQTDKADGLKSDAGL